VRKTYQVQQKIFIFFLRRTLVHDENNRPVYLHLYIYVRNVRTIWPQYYTVMSISYRVYVHLRIRKW